MRIWIFAILLTATLAPLGAAAPLCVDTTCIERHSLSRGEGSCDETSSSYVEYHAIRVSASDAESWTDVTVSEWCLASNAGDGGRGFGVGVTRCGQNDDQTGVFADWSSQHGARGSFCSTGLTAAALGQGLYHSVPCPAGPPRVLALVP